MFTSNAAPSAHAMIAVQKRAITIQEAVSNFGAETICAMLMSFSELEGMQQVRERD
jgi:HD-like signal output (HDOD) protein